MEIRTRMLLKSLRATISKICTKSRISIIEPPQQLDMPMPKDKDNKIIQTPNRAYYNRNFIVQYEVDVGDSLSAGDLILRLIDPDETISIAASRNIILRKIFISNGKRIERSRINLCEIFEGQDTNHSQSESGWKSLDDSTKKKPKQNEAKSSIDIEGRLIKLKDLYKKKLISKKIYEERQSKIIQDL